MRRTIFSFSCLLVFVLLTSCAAPSGSRNTNSSVPNAGTTAPVANKTIATPASVSDFVRVHPDLGSIQSVTEESDRGFQLNLTVTTDKGSHRFGLMDGVVCNVSGYYDQTSDIVENDLKLGDIAVGDKSDKVRLILGEPDQKSVKSEPTTLGGREDECLYWETWTYPTVQVTFMNFGTSVERPADLGSVWAITAQSAGFVTTRGIQVGDPLQKVVKAYGTTNTIREESGAYILEFGEILCITVTIRNGVVENISVQQLYD